MANENSVRGFSCPGERERDGHSRHIAYHADGWGPALEDLQNEKKASVKMVL